MDTPMPQANFESRRNSRRMSRKPSSKDWTFIPSDSRRYSLADKYLGNKEENHDNLGKQNGIATRRSCGVLVHSNSSRNIDFRRFTVNNEDIGSKTRKIKRGSTIRPSDISDISIAEEVIPENGEQNTFLKRDSLEDNFTTNGSMLHSASTHSHNESEMTLGDVSYKYAFGI